MDEMTGAGIVLGMVIGVVLWTGLTAWLRRQERLEARTQLEVLAAEQAARDAAIADEIRRMDDVGAQRAKLVGEGAAIFHELVTLWVVNFGVPDAPQPARAEKLMATFTRHGRAASAFIHEQNGLCRAVIAVLLESGLAQPETAVSYGKRIAGNMVQVGTALALPIDEFLERSLFEFRAPDDAVLHHGNDESWPSGGPIRAVTSFDRPSIQAFNTGRGT